MSAPDTPTVQSILNKASSDKFTMIMSLPPIMLGLNSRNQKDRTGNTVNLDALQFSVYGSVVPASYVTHVEVRYGGQTAKVTSYARPSYPNLNVGFAVDNGFRNYFCLFKWLSILNDDKLSFYNAKDYKSFQKIPNYHDYMTDITVIGKDEYDKDVVKFKYNHAFITRLDGFEYNNQNPEQIESKFEFAFGQFDMELI